MIYLLIFIGFYAAIDRKRIMDQFRQKNYATMIPAGFVIFTIIVFFLKINSLYSDVSGAQAMSAFLTFNISSFAEGMEKAFDFLRFAILYFLGFTLIFAALILSVKDKKLKRGFIYSLIALLFILTAGFVVFI